MKITCFLPCRKGSQRVERKNIRPFDNYANGLIEIKLQQLSQVHSIHQIILSTNDDELIQVANSLNLEKLIISRRKEDLCTSQTSTDDLINHVPDLIEEGHVLWTHVTSPFLNSHLYEKVINAYQEGLKEGYDSLMTTTELQTFIWNQSGPVNYDRRVEKWPRTQTLEPLYEVNSGAFLCHIDFYKQLQDRIGDKPKLYALNKLEGFDIDWWEDFLIAEYLLKQGFAKV